jgi:hypothetical protein
LYIPGFLFFKQKTKKMKVFKLPLIALLTAGLFTLAFYSCKKEALSPSLTSDAKGASKTIVDAPLVTCGDGATQSSINLTITAGATGAPAGFSVQWMSQEDLAANGGVWYSSDDPRLCKASFSGNANDSRYNLAAGASVTLTIGDLLMDNGASLDNCTDGLNCGTNYVFRVFAHANSTLSKSAFTYHTCSTLACDNSCGNHHFGYFKTHPELIPAAGLDLGTIHYDATTIATILNTGGSGDGLIILAHQLIAAKINGISNEYTTNADNAIGSLTVLVDHQAANWQATLSGILNKYNNCIPL